MNLICPNGCDPGYLSFSFRKTEITHDGVLNTEINCEKCDYKVQAMYKLSWLEEWKKDD